MNLLLVGATGLVGQDVVKQALADPRVTRLIAPTRRPLPAHEKLENPIVDFDKLPADAPWWKADAALCTLGTTIKQAGSQEAFRKVDFEYPLTVAKLTLAAGTPAYAIVTAVGANAKSSVFYSRTKGEVEDAIAALGFKSFAKVRPSFLKGGERVVPRPGENVGLKVMTALNFLVPKRYKIVETAAVARALLAWALEPKPGVCIIENEEMR